MNPPKTADEFRARVAKALQAYEKRVSAPWRMRKALMTSEDYARKYNRDQVHKALMNEKAG